MRVQRGQEFCGPFSWKVCDPEHGPLSSEFGGGDEEVGSVSPAAQGRHGGEQGGALSLSALSHLGARTEALGTRGITDGGVGSGRLTFPTGDRGL